MKDAMVRGHCVFPKQDRTIELMSDSLYFIKALSPYKIFFKNLWKGMTLFLLRKNFNQEE
jgi:hypothetical protein